MNITVLENLASCFRTFGCQLFASADLKTVIPSIHCLASTLVTMMLVVPCLPISY